MRPEARAHRLLSTTRAKAKMFEYRVDEADHIELPQAPQLLFSLAVGLLGNAAARIASNALASMPDEDEIESRYVSDDDLLFAATFFDSFIETHLEETLTQEFSVLCSSAYYLAGNVGSARVVALKTETPSINMAGGLFTALHALLSDDLEPIVTDSRYGKTLDHLFTLLRSFYFGDTAEEPILQVCNALRLEAYEDGTSDQLLCADIISAVVRRRLENAARTVLPPTSGLPLSSWLSAIRKSSFPRQLWPAQLKICAAELLLGKSSVIQMPTSAGKTRATELIIRSAFLSGRTALAVIVAPYRSLCHDIRGDLAKAFAGENINLDEATDSYQLDVSLEELFQRKSILIVTPEKLLYMLRRAPELASQIGLIFYDEGHQFDGMARGPTYELLLSTLKLALPQSAQVVLISAVIGNTKEIAGWLLNDPNAIVAGDGLMPTKKSIAFASWQDARGRLEYVSPADPDEREFWVPRVIEKIKLAAKKGESKVRVFPERKGTEIGLYLGFHLVANGSVAVFCGRKDSISTLCKKIVELIERQADIKMPLDDSDPAELQKLYNLFAKNIGDEANTSQSAKLGVLSHHASIPHGIRLAIEHAMKFGLARFVICTSTLAQGVNFPIKYLIVTSVQQGLDRISVRDFHNLIGRAGRAGMHTEGSVIFSSPELYDERASSGKGRWKWQQTRELLDPSNTEPSASSILALFQPYQQSGSAFVISVDADFLISLAFANRDGLDGVVANTLKSHPIASERELRIFLNERARAVQSITSYLLSHMSFAEGEPADAAASLATNTLAYYLADAQTKEQLKALFQGIAGSIATNASTDELRAVIRKSPLSPASVSQIKTWLSSNKNALAQAVGSGTLINNVYDMISGELIANSVLRSMSDKSLIPQLLAHWIAGHPYNDLLSLLAAKDVKMGKSRVDIEDVVSICESAFGYDLAMIISTMADLAETESHQLSKALARLQKQVKYGLSADSAIALYESGFADRVVSQALGAVMPTLQYKSLVPQFLAVHEKNVKVVLSEFPSYYENVFEERKA